MSDQRFLLRWLDASYFPPGLMSLFMWCWALFGAWQLTTVGLLMAVQLGFMALAATAPAAVAASRLLDWQRRAAPSGSRDKVRADWLDKAKAQFALGVAGPVGLAVKALILGQPSVALWVLSLPAVGVALGTLATWAWFGALRAAWLIAVPVGAWGLYLLCLAPPLVSQTTLVALVGSASMVGALVLLHRQLNALAPQWAGVPALLPRPQWRKWDASSRLWSWDRLAYDDGLPEGLPDAGFFRWFRAWGVYMLLGFAGSTPLKALLETPSNHFDASLQAMNTVWLMALCADQLLIPLGHWRRRLAPGGPNPVVRTLTMLAASTICATLVLWALIASGAWSRSLAIEDLQLPLLRSALNAALAVALAACLRGLWNRRVVFVAACIAFFVLLMVRVGATGDTPLAPEQVQGRLWVQALVTAVLAGLSVWLWQRRVMRGERELHRH
jgi:hypothetical protein